MRVSQSEKNILEKKISKGRGAAMVLMLREDIEKTRQDFQQEVCSLEFADWSPKMACEGCNWLFVIPTRHSGREV